ncbi:DUF262 domain-containing protein [Porphyromonas gingivalis]|uniref:DUF262 domain-containing protein n=1 Tax=Porphyromonas gingivalis TaxID=837 RepID=UPI0003AD6FE7|nr:DUF262 domain-containing protein [Porphyromonas gingivalis]ERJ86210.1 hypothetical protein HMPREF1988_00106 [Porphyromonas gingivalis F0185]PDP63871.1 DUF262 domain-containing protein [Porphyromonas gingivalis]
MLKEVEIIDNTSDEVEEFRYAITSYGADYTVDSIIQRIEKEKIFVPPFQRKYVWTQNQASRFIESLILGLPVPGVFFSKEEETERLLIIDGQQRILSIANFYKGVFDNKKFKLKGVQEDLEGKAYEDLNEADKNRLDDSILHATIIKQDTPSDDESSIYMVFERLNTGGTPLQPQEIRACVYYGEFNELLSDLVKNEYWRNIFGKENKRMKEQELILRFFSLFYEYNEYKKAIKSFINSFMAKNRRLELYSREELTELFTTPIQFIHKSIGDKAFRKGNKLNAAIFDSVMVGLAKRLHRNPDLDESQFKTQYDNLLEDKEYRTFVESSTSSESAIKGRINKAIEAFNKI